MVATLDKLSCAAIQFQLKNFEDKCILFIQNLTFDFWFRCRGIDSNT